MQFSKRLGRLRTLTITICFLALAAGGTTAFTAFADSSGTVRDLIGAVIPATLARELAEDGEANQKPEGDRAGSPSARLIFGRGDLPLLFPQRRDSIFLFDPVSGPQVVSSVKDFEPAWSPDGSKIVFISLRDGPSPSNYFQRQQYREIYTMNRDGTDQRRLGGVFFGGESQPSFSFHTNPNDQRIVYTADYSGQGTGIYTMNTSGGDQQVLLSDIEGACFTKEPAKAGRNQSRKSDRVFPGIWGGIDTPNYSPDNQHIIFGYAGFDGVNVYRINSDGSNCTLLYESEGSYFATEARYSPDGTKIALFHRVDIIAGGQGENTGPFTQRILRIIDSTTGEILNDYQPPNFWSSPVWSPDGSEIAYLGGSIDPEGNEVANNEIWTFDLTTQIPEQVLFDGVPEAFQGLSWRVPAAATPLLRIRINDPNPVTAGQSTTGTVYLSAPAPAGGTVINLSRSGATGIIDLPQSSVTVPEGATEATFPINTTVRLDHRSNDVTASRSAPFAMATATVSVSPSRPDIRIVSVDAPETVGPATPFQISSTVDNIGPVTTGSGFTDKVFFSTDAILDSGTDLEVSSVAQATLLPSGISVKQLNATIPSNRVPSNGTYYLIYEANSFRNVDEGGAYSNNQMAVPIDVVLPDLVAEDVVVPAVVEPAVNYPVSWKVRNIGGATTGNSQFFSHKLYFSFDQTIGNTDDIELSSRSDINLGPGAVITVNANISVPSVPARPSGPGKFYVKVDELNSVNEGLPDGTGETNNTTAVDIDFQYNISDLQVTAGSAPAEVETETAFPVSWTTANAGNKISPPSTDRVYFSADNQEGGDVLLGSFALPAVGPGQSVDRIQDVTIPTSAIPASGNFYVYVKADATNSVNEGENEGNNTRFIPLFVRRLLRPDLQVTNITAPNTAFFGQTIQVQWTVTNNGQGPTNASLWRDRVNLNTNGSSSTGKVAEVENITALNPGESYIASATFKIPNGLVGSYQIVLTTDVNGKLNEEVTTNNKLTRNIDLNVPPLPDLIVTNVQAPEQAFAGQEIDINWTIENIGDATARYERADENGVSFWRDRVYLSRDTILNTSQDRLIFTTPARYSPLAAGASYPEDTSTHAPAGQPQLAKIPIDVEGAWYVFVVSDFSNDVYEFNAENNNTAYDNEGIGSPMPILITPPDLVIDNAPVSPDNVTAGDSVAVTFATRNQGAFPAAVSRRDGIYFSADNVFDAADTLLASANRPALDAGAVDNLAFNIEIPRCVGGTYYLIAVTDIDNKVAEFDIKLDAEANNASPAKQIQVALTPPDLQVTSVTHTPVSGPGTSVSVTWTVANTGTGAANRAWRDRIVLVSQSGYATTLLGSIEQQPLAAGASVTRTESFFLPTFMNGQYRIAVLADHDNTIFECSGGESNNEGTADPFSVTNGLPDVVVDSASAPTTPIVAGSQFPVEWTTRNAGGALNGTTGWGDIVYLARTPNFSTTFRVLAVTNIQQPLATGETYTRQANVSTGNLAAGTYYVFVAADARTNIFEGPQNSEFETNNISQAIPVTITSPGVDLQTTVNSVAPPTYSGRSVNIEWTVTNFGDTQTLGSYWFDWVYLSRDSVIDSTDRVLGRIARDGALAASESYTKTESLRLPDGLTGDYRILVKADGRNELAESDDENNLSAPFPVVLELPPPADLNITNITVPASGSPGGSMVFQWTVQNSGDFPAVGPWRDTVYLSRDQFWDAGDILIGQSNRQGQPLNSFQSEVRSAGFQLPPIDEGNYYVIVRVDSQNRVRESNEANNVSTSLTAVPITIDTLTMNTPFNTQIFNGGFKSFKFAPDENETVLVSLVGQPGNNNSLFTNFLTAASLADYDFQGNGLESERQENLVPNTGPGPYYSLVTHELIDNNVAPRFEKEPGEVKNGQMGVPPPPQDITITATVLPFSVRSVVPERAGNAGKATLVINGAKFQPGATVELVNGGTVLTPFKSAVGNTRIAAIFDLKDKSPGTYDIRVTNPDSQVTLLEDGFEIVPGGGHSLRQSIDGPGFLRFGARNVRYTVTAANDGLNDAFLVPLLIHIPAGYEYRLDQRNILDFSSTLPPELASEPTNYHIEHEYGRIVVLMIPILRAGGEVNIGINIDPATFARFAVSAVVLPPLDEMMKLGFDEVVAQTPGFAEFGSGGASRPPSPPSSQDCREKVDAEIKKCYLGFARNLFFYLLSFIPGGNDDCLAAAAGFINGVADVASNVVLNNVVLGDKLDGLGVAGSGMTLMGSLITKGLACAGRSITALDLAFKIAGALQLLIDLYKCMNLDWCTPVGRPAANDPNEKYGPRGYGNEQFVPARRALHYQISFENLAEADAPAQRIFITDQLPPELDPRTVRLKEIEFNHQRFVVPDNRAFYSTRVDFNANGNSIKADISAGLDVINRRITWTMTAIDPQTGDLPIDPFIGLLPPNNETNDGQGFVTFTVEAYPTFPNRTPIANNATIIFDQQAPIVTNTTTNLLDSVVPTSQVAPLAPAQGSNEFVLNWTSNDDMDGSGFAYCEIRVSENNGPFRPFITSTTPSGSETFIGNWGTDYAFYSSCADNAGNIEAAPANPDATTKTPGGATESDVAPRPNGSDGTVGGDDVAQLRRFAAGLDTDLLFNEFQRADTAPREEGGNGLLSVADVMQGRRYAAGLDPIARAFGPNTASGSPGVSKPVAEFGSPRRLTPVRVSRIGNVLQLGIELESEGDESGLGFTLNFDPAILSSPRNIVAGSGASGSAVTVNDSEAASGKLGIILDRAPNQPIEAGVRQILLIEFDIAPGAPASTTMSFGGGTVTEEVVGADALALPSAFPETVVSLAGPTSANVELTGRVTSRNGLAVPNAEVTVIDKAGTSRRVRTNPFGKFTVSELPAGQTYFIQVRAKEHLFDIVVIDLASDVYDLEVVARE